MFNFAFIFLLSFLQISIIIFIFIPIFKANSLIFYFSLSPFDICSKYPYQWKIIKILFLIFELFSSIIISFYFLKIFKKFLYKKNNNCKNIYIEDISKLFLLVGSNIDNTPVVLNDKSLFQNILITGTIGSGKTSSAMYPFTDQLIKYSHDISSMKLGMLVLDVKGNYYKKVYEYCLKYNRLDDLIVIDLSGKYKYNPLHKPELKPSILANRLKTILLLFSENNSDSFWLDKAEQILEQSIKLCRLYNNNYVTFLEIHKLVTEPLYYREKIEILRDKFIKNAFSTTEIYNLATSIEFFEKEFNNLDSRTLSILKSEITRITNCFISDYNIVETFSSSKDKLNFIGFNSVVNEGKIVVLNLNISTYKNLSKIIAAYLKLDFQTEVMERLAKFPNTNFRPVCFISDEYQEYVTSSDASFFSQSREAKCINIVSTQSYTSILNTLHDESATKVIIQNLVNKLWFRTDDIFTIEYAQKQIGKTDKLKTSKSISENSKETSYSYIFNSFTSLDSNISESVNTYSQFDYIYDYNFFTQNLETFSCLSFLSDGSSILPPSKIKLFPYFKK